MSDITTASWSWTGEIGARSEDDLIGFVNVAWDDGVHTFILDTIVTIDARGQGVGTQLVAVTVDGARTRGCEWLHVDFDDHLRAFYFEACLRAHQRRTDRTSLAHGSTLRAAVVRRQQTG